MDQEHTTLQSFVDKLIAEKGLEGLDTEVLEQVRTDLLNRLEDRINASLLANLPKDKIEEFNTMIDKGDSAGIQAFTSTSIPNVQEVIAEAVMGFRATYLNG